MYEGPEFVELDEPGAEVANAGVQQGLGLTTSKAKQ